ncbi:hypothetical protein ACWD4F_12970 [Streptomyces aureus]
MRPPNHRAAAHSSVTPSGTKESSSEASGEPCSASSIPGRAPRADSTTASAVGKASPKGTSSAVDARIRDSSNRSAAGRAAMRAGPTQSPFSRRVRAVVAADGVCPAPGAAGGDEGKGGGVAGDGADAGAAVGRPHEAQWSASTVTEPPQCGQKAGIGSLGENS